MKKYIFLIICLLATAYGNIANGQSNLEKYWHYRYRLTHYFEAIGPNQGESIPANTRNGADDDQPSQILYWYDGGRILGWYIGVLATEHKLLKDYNQSTTENEIELYYALYAVYRLDSLLVANWQNGGYWYNWPTPHPNPGFPGAGIMYRDDVNNDPVSGFIATYPQVNAGIANNPSNNVVFGSGQIVGYVTTPSSDYVDGPPSQSMSIDDYQQLLLGLALASKLIEPGITGAYSNNVWQDFWIHKQFGYDLQQMATRLGNALVKYIATYGSPESLDFILLNPDGTQAEPGGITGTAIDAASFSTPLKNLGNSIFNNNTTVYTNNPLLKYDVPPWENYNLCNSLGTNCGNIQNVEQGIVAAATGNDGGNDGAPMDRVSELGNYGPSYCILCGGYTEANQLGWDQCYGSVLELLYPSSYTLSKLDLCSMNTILNDAPWDGPFCHVAASSYADHGITNAPDYAGMGTTGPGQSGWGWASDRRFMQGQYVATQGNSGEIGNFNGLDYMLMYNLYYLMSETMLQQNTVTVNDNSFTPDTYHCDGNFSGYSDIYPNWWTCTDGFGNQDYWDIGIVAPYVNQPCTINAINCGPIIVQKLNVFANEVNVPYGNWTNDGPEFYSTASGSLIIHGGVSIDLNPTQGPIIASNGSYFDAYCTNTCCNASIGNSYLLLPDPDPNQTNGLDQRQVNGNNPPPYQKSAEFDTAYSKNAFNNFPNPFTSETTIDFSLASSETVSLYITSASGQIIDKLINNEPYASGGHVLTFNGSGLAAGNYLAILVTKEGKRTIKMIKTK